MNELFFKVVYKVNGSNFIFVTKKNEKKIKVSIF